MPITSPLATETLPEATAASSVIPANKITTPVGYTVYGTTETVRNQITTIADNYPLLWQDTGRTVDILKEDWMPITLKPDVLKVDAVKVYPLGPADREFVDKEFNKLHEQERMQYTTQPTQFE